MIIATHRIHEALLTGHPAIFQRRFMVHENPYQLIVYFEDVDCYICNASSFLMHVFSSVNSLRVFGRLAYTIRPPQTGPKWPFSSYPDTLTDVMKKIVIGLCTSGRRSSFWVTQDHRV
jgi:hypothetical protein